MEADYSLIMKALCTCIIWLRQSYDQLKVLNARNQLTEKLESRKTRKYYAAVFRNASNERVTY